ncbi:hypothetical protein BH11BAC2_BH11BAC2_04510 [soil metagenome]
MINPKLSKMKHLILIIGLLLALSTAIQAQCPSPGFSIPDSVCPGKTVPISNPSSNATSWNWDYSLGDLDSVPTTSTISGGGSLNYPSHMKIVEENGNYFGFVPNNGINYITRYDFGNSPANTPTITNLTADPLFAGFAYGIEMVKENNKWIGFVSMFTGGKIIRMEFDSLTQVSPVLTDLVNTNLYGPFVIKIIDDYMFVTNQLTDISRFTFNGSYLNTPTAILPTIASGNFNNSGIDIAYDCISGKYIGYVGASSSDIILKLDFGNDLANLPVITTVYNLTKPQGVHLIKEGNTWHLFTVTDNNKFYHFTLGNSIDNPLTYQYDTNFGAAFSSPRNIQFVKKGSDWIGIIPNTLLFALIRITFPQSSLITPNFSTDQSPNNLIYPIGSTGIHYVELTETDSNGNQTIYLDSVTTAILPPEASFTSTPACENKLVQFTDFSTACSGTITGWNWNFGDTNGSIIQNPVHSYLTGGNYIVNLTVYTSNGDSSSYQQSITVAANPLANYTFTDSICSGSTVLFTDNSVANSGSISTWDWKFGDNLTDNSINPSHIYQSEGIFQATLIVTASTGCLDSISQYVHILTLPTSAFTVSNSCLGEIAQFNNTSSINSGIISSYSWDFGDNSTSNIQNPAHDFGIIPGNFIVTLISTSDFGCSDTMMQNIRIGNRPQPWFILNTDTACAGNNISCTDSSVIAAGDSIIARYWDFGDGTTDSTSLNPTHAYQNPGSYTITLTVVSPSSCDSIITRNIFVIESPVANFTTNNVCFGLSTSFQDLSAAPSGSFITNWNWNFGDTTLSSVNNPTHLYSLPGNYTVMLEVISNKGCFDTISVLTTVYDIPVTAFGNTKACTGNSVNFIDSSTVNNATINNWEWNFGVPGGTSLIQNPQFTFNDPLAYPIQLIVTSIYGCSDTLTRYLIVDPSPQFTIQASDNCFGLATPFEYIPVGFPGNVVPEWVFGDSTTSNLLNPIHIYSAAGIYPVTLTVTDLSNGCSSAQSNSINIAPKPSAAFLSDSACINYPLNFTDFSTGNNGTIISWNWTLGTHGSSTLQNPTLTIANADSFQVKLVVTSDKGCKDSTYRTAEVYGLPIVNFTATPFFGAPPMLVTFINQSSTSATYLWDFGDGSTSSTLFQPQHQYSDTGSFTPSLIVTSDKGCVDSTTRTVNVLVPYLDLGIDALSFTEVNGLWQITARLRNPGNIDVFNFSITTRLDGKSIFNENFTDTIPSGTFKIIKFKSSFYADNNSNPEYLCAEIKEVNGQADDNAANNFKCITTSNDFSVFDIYPNPFENNLNLGINIPESDIVEIIMYDTEGRKVFPSTTQILPKGYNSLGIDTRTISGGIYILEVKYRESRSRIRVMRQ